ncbi:E3 ubiquitin-protein ligase RNF166 isoform X1 [Epinephelus lanceolatus]
MMAMFRSFVSASTQLRQQHQPNSGSGSLAAPAEGIESQFSCPICLEVYHKPVSIASCAHTFCGECLQPCLQVTSPLCPLCRVPFDPKKVERSSSVEKQLASFKAPCRGCNKKVALVKMRSHIASCSKVQEQIANCPKFVPVVPTSQPIPSNIPNRSTFVCPFCGARNLDQQELVKHCMDNHRNDPNKVIPLEYCIRDKFYLYFRNFLHRPSLCIVYFLVFNNHTNLIVFFFNKLSVFFSLALHCSVSSLVYLTVYFSNA